MWQMIVGVLGFGVFVIPVFEGVLNIGNLIGMTVFGCLFLWGAFRKRIRPLLEKIRKNKAGRLLTNVLCVFLLVLAIYTAVGGGLVIHGMVNTPPEDTRVAVVLGCRVRSDGQPSKTLRWRLDTAKEFLDGHPDAVCVVTGGQGSDEPMAEADCMSDYLIAAGIAPERIYKEDKATSTKENLEFSAEIIRGEIGEDVTRIAVATSDYHCYRACLTANECDLKAYSLPARSPREMLPTYVVREIFGIIGEAFFR